MTEFGEITRCYPIRFERQSEHSASRLWRAITDSTEVGQWMGRPARIELRVGGDYYVDFGSQGELDGVIVRLEPERKLALAWGLSVLEWTIQAAGDTSRYTFVHHGQPPGLVDDEAGIAAGWHAWLDDLDHFLSEGRPNDDSHTRYQQLIPPYRKLVGEVLD